MKFKKLKIAWSVLCSVICVLLILLWVRSYWFHESWAKHGIEIGSRMGALGVLLIDDPSIKTRSTEWHVVRINCADEDATWGVLLKPDTPVYLGHHYLGFRWRVLSDARDIEVPYACPVLLFAALAAAPWIHWKWHFSLRTLLITTTLFALALGTIIWLARR